MQCLRVGWRQVIFAPTTAAGSYLLAVEMVRDSAEMHVPLVGFRLLWMFVIAGGVGFAVERMRADQRLLRDQIVRADRLATLGQLAALVGHEVNNALASISMYNSLLIEDPVDPEEQRRLAGQVDRQLQTSKRMIRDMLNYSRSDDVQLEVTPLAAALEDGLALVRHAIRAGRMSIFERYDPDMPPVAVDRGELSQVVVNLASNAIDAMGEGGELTISTGVEDGDAYVRMSDTGPGIPPEDMRRIFTPFFTTKPSDRGTGLGLSVCQTLVARYHGRITVESELGRGSTFTVWLPCAPSSEDAVAGSRAS
jgi:signal transduction histidine kinase